MRLYPKNLAVAVSMIAVLAATFLVLNPVRALPGAELTISHAVDNPLIRPGETATFIITVINQGNVPADKVTITNPLPTVFLVNSAESSRGSTTVRGQVVTLELDTLSPGERVTLKVNATVRESVKPPVDTLNNATLMYAGAPPRNATASVRITAGTLPSTGEHPDEPDFSAVWIGAMLALGLGTCIFMRYRRVPGSRF